MSSARAMRTSADLPKFGKETRLATRTTRSVWTRCADLPARVVNTATLKDGRKKARHLLRE